METQKRNLIATYGLTHEQADKVISMELPALTGSDKQIKWANDIRVRAAISDYNTLNDSAKAHPLFGKMVEIQSELFSNKDSKFWIENRESVNTYVFDKISKEA